MRIAQVAPLFESVPPTLYGGTERVVHYLTEELVRQGHEVTLFASGDSSTSATLVPCCRRALRLDPRCIDPLPHHVRMLEQVFRRCEEFDVVHFHCDYLHFPLSRRHALTQVTTLHGRLDIPDLVPLYHEFDEMPLVSISDAQRAPLSFANWVATVHHGLPDGLFTFRPRSDGYLAFVGRISPEKRVDRAIEIARRSGVRLVIAAKVDRVDEEYFQTTIRPLLHGPLVEFVGEVGQSEKDALLGGAYALVFPIAWPEPFGLVMIEAMACGTPVVAFRHGSVEEVVDEGVSGFVVDNVDEAVDAVGRIAEIDRSTCRACCKRRFAATRMAEDYLEVYERIADARPTRLRLAGDEEPRASAS